MSQNIMCPRCAGNVAESANFCPHCRRDLRSLENKKGVVDRCKWDRQPDEYAARITADQLNGLFSKTVEVDQATVGLLFDGGQFRGQLPAGRHILKSLEERIRALFSKNNVEVVLIDKGWFPLTVPCGAIRTTGGDDLRTQCDVTVRLESPKAFYENGLKAKNIHRVGDLVELIRTPVEQCILNTASKLKINSLLNPSFTLRQQLQRTLENELTPVLKEFGLRIRVPTAPRFYSSTRLEDHKLRGDMLKKLQSTKLKREYERKVIERERQWDDFQRELASEDVQQQLTDARSEHEVREVMENLKAKTESNDLFRREAKQKEWFEYLERTDDRDWSKEDRDRAREWFLEDSERERRVDVTRMEYEILVEETRNRNDLEDAERNRLLTQYDEDLKRELEEENVRLQSRLQLNSHELDHRLESRQKIRDAERGSRIDEAETDVLIDATRADEALRQEKLKADEADRQAQMEAERKKTGLQNAMDAHSRQIETALQAKAAKVAIDEEQKDAEHRRKEESESSAHARTMDEKRADNQFELERLDKVGAMSSDALFTVATPEQAGFLVKKLQAEMFKDMSGEQIMAVQSGTSDAVAEALTAKFSNVSTDQSDQMSMMKEMYDRLIAERKEGDAATRDQFNQLVAVVQQVANVGLNTQRDVGVAAGANDPMATLGQLADILKPQQPVAEPDKTPKATTKFCATCGFELEKNAMYCAGCGDPTRVGFK